MRRAYDAEDVRRTDDAVSNDRKAGEDVITARPKRRGDGAATATRLKIV